MRKVRFLLPLVIASMMLGACSTQTSSAIPSNNDGTSIQTFSGGISDLSIKQSSSETTQSSSNTPSSTPVSSTTPSIPSSSKDEYVAVTVNNMTPKICEIYDVTLRGKPGEEAQFSIRMINDYTFKSIEASTSGGDLLDLYDDGDKYIFEIPNDGVVNVMVRGNAPVNKQKLYVSDPNNVLTADPAYIKLSGPEYLTDYVTDDGEPYWKIDFNQKVRFSFPDPTDYISIGLKFNNKTYNPTKDKRNIDLDFKNISGDLHVEVFGQKQTAKLNGIGTEHLTISFKDASKSSEINEIGIGKSFYVIITSENKENYLLNTLTYSYYAKDSTTERSGSIESSVTETSTGWEILRTAPNLAVSEEGITYTATEDNLIKYINEEWCGSYVAFSTFTYRSTRYTSDGLQALEVQGSGKTIGFNRQLKVEAVQIDETTGITHLRDRESLYINEMWYKNGILVAGYGQGSAGSFTNPFYTSATDSTSDDIYAFKMIEGTTINDYELIGDAFTIANVTYIVAALYYQNTLYKAIYTARGQSNKVKVCEMGVHFEMIYGTNFYDDQSIYNVLDSNNQIINTFAFSGQGGNKNRKLLPSYGGVYSDGNIEMVLCDGLAIYNNELLVAVVEDPENAPNTYKLMNANTTMVITIDVTNKTFVEETYTTLGIKLADELAGKKFRKQWNEGSGIRMLSNQPDMTGSPAEDQYGYYIEFDLTNPTLNCVCDDRWLMTMTENNQYAYGKTYNATYCYDSTSKTAKAMIFGYNNEFAIVNFVYKDGHIEFHADELSNNREYYKNDLIICSEVVA